MVLTENSREIIVARQDDSCKRDGSGCFCIRGPGSDYRTCRFFAQYGGRFIN